MNNDCPIALGAGASKRHFQAAWSNHCARICHGNDIWQAPLADALVRAETNPGFAFALSACWAINMVPGSFRFPAYVAALASRSDSDAVRHALLENAWDESGGVHHRSRSHYWLAVRLARLLGLSEVEVSRVIPLEAADVYMNEHYRQCVHGNFEYALGMICLIEEFTTPEFSMIFKAILATCQEGLGLPPDEFVLRGGAEYFTANIADDERHREEMPRVVAALLANRGVDLDDPTAVENGLAQVAAGMQESIRLRGAFFQGIYEFVSAGGTYRDLVGPE